jgi:heme/copper-type cytochrome/quinol oxidase subunit 4
MARNQNRYKDMEQKVTFALAIDLLLFIVYLIAAGNAVIWLKVITTLFAFVISLGVLAFLYLSRELLRRRSLWMTALAASIFVCILFSLILNFPAPAPV